MSENSSIEWTNHTFNPWWGCHKVSPACQHCYAETLAKSIGHKVWGTNAPRRFFGEKYWANPIKWNKDAELNGERKRVFCASMADVFESREELDEWRGKLWELIDKTPNLDWLLLTKRPKNIESMVPWTDDWPDNVWIGTTVENQKYADERLPHLLKHNAKVRFLSCEPILGPVDLEKWMEPDRANALYGIDWIIAGGESGPEARPMNPNWVRSLRDQAISHDVPFFFKQWGQWAVRSELPEETTGKTTYVDGIEMIRLKSKKLVDRTLDDTTWDEFPVLDDESEGCEWDDYTDEEFDDQQPTFPNGSIAAYLNLCRGWRANLDEYGDFSEESNLEHPDFPGIALPIFEIIDEDKFDYFLAKFYAQAVAYGESKTMTKVVRALSKND